MLRPANITNFLGLQSGVANAPFASARDAKNFTRHRILGSLRESPGYGVKTTFPTFSSHHKITGFAAKDLHHFHVPEHGGKDVTLLAGTYTKGSYFDAGTQPGIGIFATPWWGNIITEWDNSTFENNTKGDWVNSGNHSAVASAVDKRSGTYSMAMTATAAGDGTTNYLSLPNTAWPFTLTGKSCRLVLFIRRDAATTTTLFWSVGGQSGSTVLNTNAAGEFQYVAFDFTATNNNEIRLWLTSSAYNRTVYIDDIQLLTWIDAGSAPMITQWQEVTEMYVVKAIAVSPQEIQIGQGGAGPDDILAVDTNQAVFNSRYLQGWTVMPQKATAYEDGAGIMVSSVRVAGSNVFLVTTPIAGGGNPPGITAGDKLFLMRNVTMRNLDAAVPGLYPTTVGGKMFSDTVENSVRVTTGNTLIDFNYNVFFKDALWSWKYAYPQAFTYTDSLVVQNGCLDHWSDAVRFDTTTMVGAAAGNGLPKGDYQLGLTIGFDGGSESALVYRGAVRTVTAVDEGVQFKVIVNYGCLPKNARFVNLYMSKDNGSYLLVQKYSLRAYDTAVAPNISTTLWEDDASFSNTLWLRSQTTTFGASHWNGATDAVGDLIQRSQDEVGSVLYKYALTVGSRRFLCGVTTQDSILQSAAVEGPGRSSFPNHIFECAQHGDGLPQLEVFPAANTLDLEYNDGDQIVAVGALGESLAAFGRKVVMLEPDGVGGFDRRILSRQIGISSPESLIAMDDALLWTDNSGQYILSTGRGLQMVSSTYNEEILLLSPAQKALAVSMADRDTRKIHMLAGTSKDYVYDAVVGGVLPEIMANVPDIVAQDMDGGYTWLSGANTNIFKAGSSTRHNGANFTMFFETNPFTLTDPGVLRGNLDIIPRWVFVEMESSVDLTVEVYRDFQVTPFSTHTVSSGNKRARLRLPKSKRCKGVRVKVTATTTADDQKVLIKEIAMYYHMVRAGGTRDTETT